MHVLSLNLQRGGSINASTYGNFSGTKKTEEFIVARGSVLELLRIEPETDKLASMKSFVSILQQPVFCVVRSLIAFRLTSTHKDYCVVGTDAGKITILEYLPDTSELKAVHVETFGKTGCRRIVPGQYLAADPQGRAIMISAVEKQKLVYVLNRDTASRLAISSPLEAHKSNAIVFHTCGVDVGFDNPIFAVIELDYSEADQDSTGEEAANTEKQLVYYQLDLGLNHVTRLWSDPISRGASLLLPVPGGEAGPSGVLVCGENWVAYKHQDHPEVRAAIPRRKSMPPDRGLLITSGTLHQQPGLFFHLIQSELGDLYKVSLVVNPEQTEVTDISIEVFDAIPVANSLHVTKRGRLFCASEFSNHMLFYFHKKMGGEEGAVVATQCADPELDDSSEAAASVALSFTPSAKLNNLIGTDEVESLAPLTDMLVGDLAREDTPQMYTLCGRGNQSTLRILRHGLAVTELAENDLPGVPSAVFAFKERLTDPFDRYIVLSFTNATMVLEVQDSVEEVENSGFLATSSTLDVKLMRNNKILQVYSHGLRVIMKGQPPQEWRAPGKKQIEKACANERQVVLALAGGEIIFFELDEAMQNIQAREAEAALIVTSAACSWIEQEVGTKPLGGVEIACLEMGEVPKDRVRAPFLAVGDWNGSVKMFGLSPDNFLQQVALMNLPAPAESLCLAYMATEQAAGGSNEQLFLYVGLTNGVCQRVAVDATAGTLSDPRQRFLGSKAVKLFRIQVQDKRGVLALSSRSWLSYNYQGRYQMTPLSYDPLDHAAEFSTEMCPEGVVAVSGEKLRIFGVERLGEMFNQAALPLRYTPRQIALLPGDAKHLVVVEADHNEYNQPQAEAVKTESGEKNDSADKADGGNAPTGAEPMEQDQDEEDEDEATAVLMPIRGPLPPQEGSWASCIRLLDPVEGATVECLELGENEAAFSVAPVTFHNRGGESFVVVGTAKGLTFHPKNHEACFLHVYRVLENRLVLLHKTEIQDVPLAMQEFQGRLLVGIGNCLRMYDLGRKKLLRKCENKQMPTMVVSLTVTGDRVFAGDQMESCHCFKYRRGDNQLVEFADDQVPRFMTKTCLLDYDSMAGADKFGNIFVLRIPADVSDDVDNPTGNRLLWDSGHLSGAPNKVEQQLQFHVGEVVTSLRRTALVPGGAEVLLYSTINGSIGALLPFKSRDDVDFFTHMEMYMRQEKPTLCGRDHISYRSYYLPAKDVIDGDLCEQFSSLPYDKQKLVATGLDRTVGEVVKKLEDTRNRLL
ncbi:unnamed protein product [Ascophyllum nodosum]